MKDIWKNRSMGVSFKSRLGLVHSGSRQWGLGILLGQPQKTGVLAPDVFPACTVQNFKVWGRRSGGGISLRRNLKETPMDRFQAPEFFKNLNCYKLSYARQVNSGMNEG
jgi:hypothetical protein